MKKTQGPSLSLIALPLIALSLIALTLWSTPSHARWAPVQNATYVIENESDTYDFRKDGTTLSHFDLTIELLTDEARNEFGLYRMPYDAKSGHLTVIEAYALNRNGKLLKRTNVKPSDIEDKPLASSGPGFDQINQVTIPFSELKAGSKIHLVYQLKDKAVIPGYFGLWFPIGHNEYVKSWSFKVHSYFPLVTDVRDPDHSLKIKTSEHDIEAQLLQPIYRAVIEEENGLEDLSAYTWLGLSTFREWKDVPNQMIQKFETKIASPLPEAFQKIADKAAAGKTMFEQINLVTSLLQDQVRYVGDWRRVDGGYYPRELSQISETGYGDCKDFSTATNAILRHLGFETHPALIRRERYLSSLVSKIPVLDFNHAISFARKEGHEFWIDPTNLSSNAQGIYNDIENRPALILFPDGAKIARTPPLSVGAGTSRSVDNVKLIEDQILTSDDHLEWTGQSAAFLTGWGLSYSKPNLDYTLLKWVADPNKVRHWTVDPYDMSSRIVHDLSVDFHVEQSWQRIITTRGTGMSLPGLAQVAYFNIEPDKRVSGLKLEDPYTWLREIRLSGRETDMRSDLKDKLSCSGDSLWIRYSRRFEKESSVTVLRDEVTLKESYIPVDQIKTDEFKAMQKKLNACMSDAIVILK